MLLNDKIKKMKKLFLVKFVLLLVLFSGCQTINDKSEEIAKKENEKLSKFIGQPESELRIVMGNPDGETKDEKGSKILIYKSKKYAISCERKFEINEVNMIIGFTSKGCF
jgi:outer membrane lipoprotein-sorting protein